jgi:hypothetical protein
MLALTSWSKTLQPSKQMHVNQLEQNTSTIKTNAAGLQAPPPDIPVDHALMEQLV